MELQNSVSKDWLKENDEMNVDQEDEEISQEIRQSPASSWDEEETVGEENAADGVLEACSAEPQRHNNHHSKIQIEGQSEPQSPPMKFEILFAKQPYHLKDPYSRTEQENQEDSAHDELLRRQFKVVLCLLGTFVVAIGFGVGIYVTR